MVISGKHHHGASFFPNFPLVQGFLCQKIALSCLVQKCRGSYIWILFSYICSTHWQAPTILTSLIDLSPSTGLQQPPVYEVSALAHQFFRHKYDNSTSSDSRQSPRFYPHAFRWLKSPATLCLLTIPLLQKWYSGEIESDSAAKPAWFPSQPSMIHV